MYHLIFSSPILQIWQSTNGWRVNVIRGKFSSRSRYPAPGSKRWYAMLPQFLALRGFFFMTLKVLLLSPKRLSSKTNTAAIAAYFFKLIQFKKHLKKISSNHPTLLYMVAYAFLFIAPPLRSGAKYLGLSCLRLQQPCK